ncbi:hypothetical protein PSHT_04063 [Puccinia striiformis]|uniref:Phosphatidylinositol-specific phospholipase C X domain-containing protein n=1 Tax=Puccinia striiformis TaxID=27350 RepID=A0A2S4WDR3_9BASI|nr:hypothetical protein PSHT_04063 [Puccinia striiformis]
MVAHYLPISVSNRTAATIQVQYEASSSSSKGYTDTIGSFQTTPTKAVKTDFKLQHLESLISIDLEEPKLIKIQLRKKRRIPHRHENNTSSASSATTSNDNKHASKKDSTAQARSATIKNNLKKTLLGKAEQNGKFLRLQVNYFLNSQPLKLRDQDIIEDQDEDEQAQVAQTADVISGEGDEIGHQETRGETADISVNSPQAAHGSPTDCRNGGAQPRPKKLFIPKFEIFQSISDDGSVSIMILKNRDFSNWMADLPDEVPISELTIPGSHQSCALYGWPVARCQTRSLARQLKDGIRFLDIRLALPTKATVTKKKPNPKSKGDGSGKLVAYHGIQSQVLKFQEILGILDDFLTNQPTETVIISIKRENHSNSELFKKTLLEEFIQFYQSDDNFKSHWWLNAFLPNSLKQVRGKLILFSRKLFQSDDEEDFGSGFQFGQTIQAKFGKQASPTQMLPYDLGSCFSICKKSTLACISLCGALHEPLRSTASPVPPTQPPNRGALASKSTGIAPGGGEDGDTRLTESTAREPGVPNENPRTWVITFLSASSLFLGFPSICSRGIGFPKSGLGIEGINSRVARWLVSRRDHYHHPGPNVNATSSSNIKGVVCLIDFYQSPKEGLVSLLVDCNFTS